MRALAGISLRLARRVSLVSYVDATWVQPPRDDRAQRFIGSGIGVGAELRVAFIPALRLVDMLFNGTNSPEAF
jgi:hypothetical protein